MVWLSVMREIFGKNHLNSQQFGIFLLLWILLLHGQQTSVAAKQHRKRPNVSSTDQSDILQGSKLKLSNISINGTCVDLGRWLCNDRVQCIDHEQRCDGTQHCSDGSDEIAANCIFFDCPAYAFRCAYGGCIAGRMRCDGNVDCADGSDETEFLCADFYYPEIEQQLRGHCSWATAIECASGECIDQEHVCDGRVDCVDSSDESVRMCSYLYCPSYAFLCGYGACVRGNTKCNGVSDCADGSDEIAELCGFERDWNATVGPSKKNTTGLQPSSVRPVIKARNRCRVPFYRKHLMVVNLADQERLYRLGDTVGNGTSVGYFCAAGWQLNGVTESVCQTGRWSEPVPHCTKNCSAKALLHGISSTTIECIYNGSNVDCAQDDLPMGTKAKVKCTAGYWNRNDSREMLTCDQDAEWDYPKMKCEPICGRLSQIDTAARPWEVSIFRRPFVAQVPQFENICRGVIISPRLVVSAGACLQTTDGYLESSPVLYNIRVGQHTQSYVQSPTVLDIKHGIHNVSEILLINPSAPMNEILLQPIVFVLVNYFQFGASNGPQPICLELPQESSSSEETIEEIDNNSQFDIGTGISSIIHNSDSGEALHYLDTIVSRKMRTKNTIGKLCLAAVKPHLRFIQKQIDRYYYLL